MPVAHDQYAALGIDPDDLRTIAEAMGCANTSDRISVTWYGGGRSGRLSDAQITAFLAEYFEREAAERFGCGEHDLAVARFVVDAGPEVTRGHYSILWMEAYPGGEYPVLVDGHVQTRAEAVRLWLGDTDAAEHPDLYLAQDA